MSKLKSTETMVIEILKVNKKARCDDFILYGSVLKRLGVDLNMSLKEFLANAKYNNMPALETIPRCRRKLCEINPELVDTETDRHRKEEERKYINYANS